MAELKISAMDHIVLNVVDIERSLAFYTDVLGLGPERVEAFRRGEVGFPSVRISESTLIDLMRVDASTVREGVAHNLNHFCLVAEDLDLNGLVEMLKAKDVPV